MKRVLFFLLLLMMEKQILATDLTYIRNLFFEASQSKQKTDMMMQTLLKAEDKSKPILRGYTGMTYMLLAKHGFNFVARYNNFQKGKEMLEKAIYEDKNNVELRFLRLSVQMNVPTFLNYSKEIENDKAFIRMHYTSIKDMDLRTRITNYFSKKNIPIK
jgi:hypothetical protein